MHTVTSVRRRLGAFGLTLVLAGAVAAPAQAAPAWMGGTIENSVVRNCNFDPESGILANAEFYADGENLPRIGEVFYVRTIPARVGGGCGVRMSVHVEVVPPPDVTVAISPETPVRCTWLGSGAETSRSADGCPQRSTPGLHGFAFDQVPSGGGTSTPWTIPHGMALSIEIPLRSARRLAGPTTQLPSCGRRYGDPPCRPDQAGDHLQFGNWVTDGNSNPWLGPYVPLSVQDGSARTAPTSGTALIVSPPRTVRTTRLLRGLPIRVRVEQPSSRIIATVSLRGRGVAKAEVSRAPAGTQTVRLRPTTAGKRTLRRLKRSTRAVLTVVVKRPNGGGTSTTRRNITLRP